MVDSFMEAQNSFKARELPGLRHSAKKGEKARNSLLVHTCDHEVTGLKTHHGPKRKQHFSVCSLPARCTTSGPWRERRPTLIVAGQGRSIAYRIQQVDPHGDRDHMGYRNRMKPAVSDESGSGQAALAASFT